MEMKGNKGKVINRGRLNIIYLFYYILIPSLFISLHSIHQSGISDLSFQPFILLYYTSLGHILFTHYVSLHSSLRIFPSFRVINKINYPSLMLHPQVNDLSLLIKI